MGAEDRYLSSVYTGKLQKRVLELEAQLASAEMRLKMMECPLADPRDKPEEVFNQNVRLKKQLAECQQNRDELIDWLNVCRERTAAGGDFFQKEYLSEQLAECRRERDALREAAICGTCGGNNISIYPCVCKGEGTVYAEAQGLRKAYFDLKKRLDTSQGAIEVTKENDGE